MEKVLNKILYLSFRRPKGGRMTMGIISKYFPIFAKTNKKNV